MMKIYFLIKEGSSRVRNLIKKAGLKTSTITLVSTLVFLLLVLTVYAAVSYRLPRGEVSRVEEFVKARNAPVQGSCPGDLFVPTKTSGEYDSFIGAPPSCAAPLVVRPICNQYYANNTCDGALTFVGSIPYLSGDYENTDLCEANGANGITCCMTVLETTCGYPEGSTYNTYTSFGSYHYVGVGSQSFSGPCTNY